MWKDEDFLDIIAYFKWLNAIWLELAVFNLKYVRAVEFKSKY